MANKAGYKGVQDRGNYQSARNSTPRQQTAQQKSGSTKRGTEVKFDYTKKSVENV